MFIQNHPVSSHFCFRKRGSDRARLPFLVRVAAALSILVASALTGRAIDVGASTLYDAIPSVLPGNVPSVGYEATSTSEFGDLVRLAYTGRELGKVTVLMSSWGCEDGAWTGGCLTTPGATFDHPLTLNIYAVSGGQPGALLASKTETFSIPYRPSADPINCAAAPTKWYNAADATCNNGLAVPVEWDFSTDGIVLPQDIIWTVAYDTTHYGANPIGTGAACYASSGGCGYDSLNVGVQTFAGSPFAGTDLDPDGAVLDSTWGGAYCDGGAGGTGTLRVDTSAGCWAGYTPLATIEEPACAPARYVSTSGSNAGNPCDSAGTPCQTIQWAVDQACPDETVHVAAGSYQEQVTIDKGLTLSGAGAGSTTVLAPAQASRAVKSADHGFGLRNYDYLVGVFGKTLTLEVAPSEVPDEQPPRINAGDAPAGFASDSWQGPATGKSNWHARYLADGDALSKLFPTDALNLKVSDIASISYFTKRPVGTPAGRDWWIQIYTRPTGSGDKASWYHDRFINNYASHTNIGSWTQYSTSGGMTFQSNGWGGPVMDLATFIATHGTQKIEMISVQTDSGWNGFDGYIDGLEVRLVNGKVGRVNFGASTAGPTAETVNVSGFTLDGNLDAKTSGPGTFRSQQLTFFNMNGTISDNSIEDWQNPSAFGVQGVASVVVGSATAVDVEVSGNGVTGYQKGGIVAYGTGAVNADIADNVVAGAGPITSTAQNGVQISNGAGGTIQGNDVSGNNYTPATFCATGVLVLSDDVLVRNNDLAGNLCDIIAQANGTVVEGNNIPAALSYPLTVLGNDSLVDKNYVNGSTYDAVYNDGINNVFTCNRITNNGGAGFYFDSSSGFGSSNGTPNTATSNLISGNAIGLDASAVTILPPVDAQSNYWGCATGANSVGCDTAVGNADVTPSVAGIPVCVTCAGAGGDSDNDGICTPLDNCPDDVNVGQENADGDTLGDACDACPDDPDNDVDGDTVCGDVDNCPDDANLDQADTDGDGLGNVCDVSDGEGTMVLSRALARADAPGGAAPSGKVSVNALISDDTTGNFLPDNLTVDGNVRLEITAGPFAATVHFGTCTAVGTKKIRCRNGDAKGTFRLVPQSANVFPNTWKMKATLIHVADGDSPVGPVTVVLVQPTPSLDRDDDISACTAKPGRLSCRER
jgi:hypothetical protein